MLAGVLRLFQCFYELYEYMKFWTKLSHQNSSAGRSKFVRYEQRGEQEQLNNRNWILYMKDISGL